MYTIIINTPAILICSYHEFAKEIESTILECKSIIEDTENIVKRTMSYYGEQYPECSLNDFVMIIVNFIDDIESNRHFPKEDGDVHLNIDPIAEENDLLPEIDAVQINNALNALDEIKE